MYKLPMLKHVKELLENKFFINEEGHKKTGFLFWSKTSGTGKTLLGLSILNSLAVDFKLKCRYENTTNMLSTLKHFFNKDKQDECYNELDYLDQLVNYDVLMLDDIGSEKVSDWVREKFYFIQEGRNIKPNKINIFTSNDSPEVLASKIGDKVVSRIIEYCELIKFEGTSWRSK